MNYFDKLALLEQYADGSAHARRICSEIRFLSRLSAARGGIFDQRVDRAASELLSFVERDGTVTKEAARSIEDSLLDLSPEAKKYRVHLAAHAHIDMNWLWGYEETAAVTVGTFRTMLKLLDRFPLFRFSQSQASTYEILEKFAPPS